MLYCMLRTTVMNHAFFDTEMPALNVLGDNVITKRPMDIWAWPEIREKYPETGFIVTLRDPRCMVTSRHPKYPRWTAAHDHYMAGKGPDATIYPYGGVIPVARKIRELQASDANVMTVRYEDLVDDPHAVQQEIGRRFGLAFCGRFDAFHEREEGEWPALRGIRAVDPENKHRWKNEPDRIREQFGGCEALFDLVEEYGYETDRSWYDAFRVLGERQWDGPHHAADRTMAGG